MAIDKLRPVSPDPIIDSDRYGGSTLARLAHVNYVIEQVNTELAGMGIPTLSQVLAAGNQSGSTGIQINGAASTIMVGTGLTGQDLSQTQTFNIASATGDATFNSVTDNNGIIKPYKSYVATLSQPGDTSNPVPVVMENNLSAAIVWTRTGVGTYTGTLAAAFTNNKTTCMINMLPKEVGNEVIASFATTSLNTVDLSVYEADGSTASEGFTATLEIRVYN